MKDLKRLIGVVLIVIAAIVGIHTVIEPVYHTGDDASSAWIWINYLSAISIIVGLIFGYIRMRRADAGASVQEFIAANTVFYGFLFVAILFFRNWFGITIGQDFTAISADVRSLRATPAVEWCNGCLPFAF